MTKSKTVIQACEEIAKIQESVEEMPYNVWRVLVGNQTKFSVFHDCIGLPGNETDYATKEEWQEAIEWLVTQFGGTVKWKKSKSE